MTVNLPWYRRGRLQAVALFVFSCLLYANTLGHDFVLDDAIVITDNTLVQRGIAGWPELFTHDTFYGFFGEQERGALVAGGRYRPLTPALFAVEQQLAQGPFVSHLLNIFWYALLVVVLWGMLRELLRGHALPWWVAPAAAALFAAHPLHTEAVANIKGRDEIMALLGAAAAAWLLLWAQRRNVGWGGFAGAVAFLLGCLAKENAITFAAVIPLLLYVARGGGYRHVVPVLVAAAVFLLLRGSVLGWSLGEPSLELMNNPFLQEVGGRPQPLGFWERQPTVLYTLLLYLKLLVWPADLVHDYYPAAIELKTWADPWVWLSLLLHVGLLVWSALHLRSRPKFVALGVLVYLLTLSVVSNVLFPVGTFMSERFLFMPSLGAVLAVVSLLARRPVLGWGLLPVILLFGVLTVDRNGDWRDNYTLFTSDLERQPRSAKLLNAAAGAALDRAQGQDLTDPRTRETIVTARERLNEALRIHPRYGNAYLLRGNAAFLMEDYTAAIADYEWAQGYGVGETTVTKNLVLALQRAARKAGEEENDLAKAKAYLLRADSLLPNQYETLRLLGISSGVGGDNRAALEYFRRALELAPDNEGAQQNYAIALRLNQQLAPPPPE
ncbi:hypothetical protein LEM8419_02712 [Neolewinella maritima]|uniref:Dolichyl-phosphate-mannose--protein mannosyltransferase n=1 Tax=Neolewinella maritima TaxID=1383882 RepID=A0ABN8F4F8_9BACT|nr:DUF1736 domain-containing protein [Neolewinella maritima]CAH1001805.1 hypothetical protein LEM8419_02712 [Neolewinella maritima]